MYNWIVYIHMAAAFAFVLSHGASVSMAFALRRERDSAKVRALLELSLSSYGAMYGSLMTLLVFGIIAGFAGNWWGHGWIWLSLLLLVVMIGAMTAFGSISYGKIRRAVGIPARRGEKSQPPMAPASEAEIIALLEASQPMLLAVIGLGGLFIIVWLMRFKPF